MSSTPIQRDEDYYEDSDEIILKPIVSSEKISVKRNARYRKYDRIEMRPRREQQSPRQQFYNMLIDILATLQSSTKNDIRRAYKRELEKGFSVAER